MSAITGTKSSKPAADSSSELAARLLDWYRHNQRMLPWRGTTDPYAVWVSEIMLQQTRVETVIPYYRRWMEQFPTLLHLARADEQQVLKAWEGMGYYSRARSLHSAAQLVVEKHQGRIPASMAELMRLPGIGRYTAAAIASIAFGQDEPALDGNLRRVAARLFNISLPARSPEGESQILAHLRAHLPPGRAGDFNQALMDLGATICTPRKPACQRCPLADLCQAKRLGVQEERPVLTRRAATPLITVTAAVIWRDGKVLLTRRPAKGLLGGMWEFPGGKQEAGETLPECLRREIREELGVEIEVGEPAGVYRHAYSHFKVKLHAFTCRVVNGEPLPHQADGMAWAAPEELSRFPMGKIDRQIAANLLKSNYSLFPAG
ncbi:MAG: A/G-specific adenine glycosylase [Bellilinea sp.]|nr:MAG: A/G-specific adenine glycosylase [Bellilinea sp.]